MLVQEFGKAGKSTYVLDYRPDYRPLNSGESLAVLLLIVLLLLL